MSDVVRVTLLSPWEDPRALAERYNRMTPDGSYEWRSRAGLRIRLVVDDPEPDHWVVINAPPEAYDGRLDPARTIVFQLEPDMAGEHERTRWGPWAAPSPTTFLQVRDHPRHVTAPEWWVGATYAELRQGPPPEKTGLLSACISRRYHDPGHIVRVDLLRHLDAQPDLDLDVWGDDVFGFRRARGRTPRWDKTRALLPYRYYVDAENHARPGFVTEKLFDPILAEALVFYWGAPNADAVLDPEAFVALDAEDVEAAAARIRAAIASDEWSRRLPAIRAEKRRILDEVGFFPTLARVLDGHHRPEPGDATGVIGDRRAGRFVTVSDRTDGTPTQTRAAEQRAQWTGLVVEADPERRARARVERDALVAREDRGPLADELRRHGIRGDEVDWLELAVADPAGRLADGTVDLATLRPDVITFPVAVPSSAVLGAHGYDLDDGGSVARRRGTDDVVGWYHLFAGGDWRRIVDEQLAVLDEHGLAAASRRIHAGVVGPERGEAIALLEQTWGNVEVLAADDPEGARGERSTLEHCRARCATERVGAGVWYLHTKGVTRGDPWRANVDDWRALLHHGVVERWRECAAALERHDVVAVNWRTEPAPHASGNAWWARPGYLARLPARIQDHPPIAAELWIGGSQPAVRCLHDSGIDHYVEPYPRSRYAVEGDR